MKAIMLAAGMGRRLDGDDGPAKPLLKVGGKSLLARHVEILRRRGVDHLVLVIGHRADELEDEVARIGARDFVRPCRNPDYMQGSLLSLWRARDSLRAADDVLIMDADVLYHPGLIDRLLTSSRPDCLLIDRDLEPGDEPVKVGVRGSDVVEFGKTIACDRLHLLGEWPGFMKLSAATGRTLLTVMRAFVDAGASDAPMEDAVSELIRRAPGALGWEDVTGLPWIEIDFAEEDLVRARRDIWPRLEAIPELAVSEGV